MTPLAAAPGTVAIVLAALTDCGGNMTGATAAHDTAAIMGGLARTRQQIARIPLSAGTARAVLYSAVFPTPAWTDQTTIFADPSGQWVIVAATTLSPPANPPWRGIPASWVADGRLHPLPGNPDIAGSVFAW